MDLESLASKFSLYKEISDYNLSQSGPVANGVQPTQNDPQTAVSDAAVVEIKDSAFDQKLYKHINDYYTGKGNLSKSTASELVKKDHSVATDLTQLDPVASAKYMSYRTAAFSYGSQARFVTGVESATKATAELKKAYKA